jgi:magnesium-dependent phosphatase 1
VIFLSLRPPIEYVLSAISGSKITHFKALKERTGIPYSEMVGIRQNTFISQAPTHLQQLFFDDELRNREVEQLGAPFHPIPRSYIAHHANYRCNVLSRPEWPHQ